MLTRFWQVCIVVCVCCAVGCSGPSDDPDAGLDKQKTTGIITVYVVNYPLKYFAERIGGEHVDVVFPAPEDKDPAYWRPRTNVIADYQNAELVLLNGASYAKWTKTASLPNARLVETSASFRDRYIKIEDAVTHTHGPAGDHSHAGTAFTTWLDPGLAAAQASAIRDAFIKRRPQHADEFKKNFEGLEADLNKLDTALTDLVSGKSDRPILFSHPVYQYLTRRYGLNAKSVHWEPDEMPSPDQWEQLAELLKVHPAKWMVWEGTPEESTSSRLAEMGIRSVIFDPCGNRPEQGDYLEAMHRNTEALRRVYAE